MAAFTLVGFDLLKPWTIVRCKVREFISPGDWYRTRNTIINLSQTPFRTGRNSLASNMGQISNAQIIEWTGLWAPCTIEDEENWIGNEGGNHEELQLMQSESRSGYNSKCSDVSIKIRKHNPSLPEGFIWDRQE